MRVNDIIRGDADLFQTIIRECSQFIEESHRRPLIKALPSTSSDVRKIKVRKKKTNSVNESFARAFGDYHPELRQRAMIACGNDNQLNLDETTDAHFVYPIDGFKYIYSATVVNSDDEYKPVFEHIDNVFGNTSGDVINDMLQLTYCHSNLAEGMSIGAEIVIYNIPYYYAVRVNDETVNMLTHVGAM